MQEDKVTGDNNKEDKDEEEQEHNQEEAALTKNMNAATEKLNLSLLDGEQEQDVDEDHQQRGRHQSPFRQQRGQGLP
jgi:hypothetical protein